MDEKGEMWGLAITDLQRSEEHLYVAAQRFVRTFERVEIHHLDLGDAMTTGTAAGMLHDASQQYDEAYRRAEAAGVFKDDGI